jgi:hypothetical protein
MPDIKIWERDETGVTYDGSETVVFVPGTIDISTDVQLDENGCYLIIPAPGDDVLYNLPSPLLGNEYIEYILKSGL